MYTVGIELFPDGARMGVLGREFTPIFRQKFEFAPGSAPLARMEQLAHGVEEAALRYPIDRIGVATAQSIDLREGTVHMGEWYPVRDVLQELTGQSIWLDSSAQAGLMTEWMSGACIGAEHVVYLEIGPTVNGAVIADGRMQRGRNGSACSFGMIPMGGGETLESLLSTETLERMSDHEYVDTVRRALDGDRRMRECCAKYCESLIPAAELLLACYAPDVLMLGGAAAECGRYFPDILHDNFASRSLWSYDDETLLTVVRHTQDGVLVGAASLAEYYNPREEEE